MKKKVGLERRRHEQKIEQVAIGMMVTSAILFCCFVLYVDYLDRVGF